MSNFIFKNSGKKITKNIKYNDINIADCEYVINFILKNKHDPATKMVNPKTKQTIEIQNDVSRLILSSCWKNHSKLRNQIKKIAPIHDIDPSLNDSPLNSSASSNGSVSPNGAAKSQKSNSPMGVAKTLNSNSPMGAKTLKITSLMGAKTLKITSPMGAAKTLKSNSPMGAAKTLKSTSPIGVAKTQKYTSNNSYTHYYNKLHTINDRNVSDFIVTNGNYIKDYDIYEIEKIIGYMRSCNALSGYSELSFKEYGNHIKKILKILVDLFKKIEFVGSVNIIGYDTKSIPLFRNYININVETLRDNACIQNMDLQDFEYIEKVYNQNIDQAYNVDTIICNSIFNKLFILNVDLTNKERIDIRLNPEFKDNIHLIKNDVLENILKKHNKIFPKYFGYEIITNTKNITAAKNDIDLIFAIINYYCKSLLDSLKIQNLDTEHNKSLKIMDTIYNNNNEDNSKLLCCLYNNNYNEDNNYYHNNYYDGPYYLNVINCYKYYYELYKFQYRNIPNTILNNIASAYKNSGIFPFSKLLNEELYSLMKDTKSLTIPIQSRLIEMYKYLDHAIITPNTNETLYLYHGISNTRLTESKLNEVVVMGFLSCSFNLNVAYAYSCNRGLNPHTGNFIYVLQIQNTIDYINFNDNLKQIILLPGTIIEIKNEIIIGNITYIICTIKLPKDKLFNAELRKAILKNNQELINLGNYDINDNNHFNLQISDHQMYRNNFYIIQKYSLDNDYYIYCKLNNNNNNTFNSIKYTLHQHLINDIYSYFIDGDDIIAYNIFYSNGPDHIKGIYTGWILDDNFSSAIGSTDFRFNIDMLLIDSLLENDNSEKETYLISNTYNTDEHTKRINFKGGFLYDKNLNERTDYFKNASQMTLYELLHGLDTKMSAPLNPFVKNKYTTIITNCNPTNINAYSPKLLKKYEKIIQFLNLNNKEQTDKLMNLITQLIDLFKNRCNLLFKNNDAILTHIQNKKTGGLVTLKQQIKKMKPSVMQLSISKQQQMHLFKLQPSTTQPLINDIKLDNVDFPIKNIVSLKKYDSIYKNILKMNR